MKNTNLPKRYIAYLAPTTCVFMILHIYSVYVSIPPRQSQVRIAKDYTEFDYALYEEATFLRRVISSKRLSVSDRSASEKSVSETTFPMEPSPKRPPKWCNYNEFSTKLQYCNATHTTYGQFEM